MKKSLAIVGAGAWGSALAIALSEKFDQIFLITKDNANTDRLGNQHEALSIPFNSNISIGSSFEAIKDSQAVLIATPSSSFNSVLTNLEPHINRKPVAWVTKGFDPDNGKLLHESFSQKLPNHHPCVISGPTFAAEIVEKKPAAIVVASKDKITRDFWAETIQTNNLRAYTNSDIVGVQVGGSVKNILAIAAGIANGLGFGANTQAALITRGLAEMTRLGVALGADKVTFQGLSGMGDLILTCSDDLSRNRRFGKELANNIPTDKALKNINATVEGFKALKLVIRIANNHQIEMPICEQVLAVTEGKITPREAVNELLLRKPNEE
ncbi:MAG: NAD(P)H-dependent glycerol-3-phosphate dehydrogenase [Gammaproteobacteria bacterium]|jgi:glycerol-3-phosphate dehydrogenase (NAD(P)+)|tara:strand:+ start:378 stop:1352 length:975 start_codon:yes stop_codon:yes gene_type:complete